jgi:hypothetical protein
MQGLMDEMGHVGPCSYYFLVELCAEKLNKLPDRALEASDCEFEFSPRIVRQNLRLSLANVQVLLGKCQTFGLLSFNISETSIKILCHLIGFIGFRYKKSRHGARCRAKTPRRE